jgi:kumamolisin
MEELEAKYGASGEDIQKVEAFAREHGLEIMEKSPSKRSVVLSGTVAQLNTAFNVNLACYKHPLGTYRGREGPIYLPAQLIPIVHAVLGLDDRPQARAHMRLAGKKAKASVKTYTPPQVAQLYNFPSGDGSGQCVAIIELGGGYNDQDLQTYFSGLGIPEPDIQAISVDGTQNSPTGDPDGPDGEVMLDIEIVGSLAPGAQVCVYFAPNTSQGFVDAVSAAVHDSTNKPSIISISWGDAEVNWTEQGMQALDQAFQDAAMVGVTVCAASGDNGSSDGVNDGLAHVDFPASSQYVLGCGGTLLKSSGTKIKSQVVWNDQPADGATGGGISDVYSLPEWQDNADVPPSVNPGSRIGRGVPDVAGDADPSSGYNILVDGSQTPIGGTSAVAPLWSGLFALINQQLGKPVGYLNPLLYGNIATSGGLQDITSGNNGAYRAKAGWDACTGLGSPNGKELLAALQTGFAKS